MGAIPLWLTSLSGALGLLLLVDSQLTGTIPPQLSVLTKLSYLYIHNNRLTGTIPSQLSALTAMYKFQLSENQLTGTVPSQLSAMTGLRDIYLTGNQLTGTVPPELCAIIGRRLGLILPRSSASVALVVIDVGKPDQLAKESNRVETVF